MKSFLYSCLFLLLGVAAHAQKSIDELAKNKPTKLVNDWADVLSPADEQALEQQLVAYDDSTSTQIAILTLKTLDGYPIEEAALKIFRSWGIGNKKTNNGVLIITAIDDRAIRIEVGYGLEGAIPDITASQIIRNDIGPNFRSGNYYEGLQAAANSIIKAAAGEYQAPEGYGKKGKDGGGNILGVIILFIIIIIVLSNINRGGGGGFMSRRGYRGFGPGIFWPGGGWSGGGGGGGWSGGGGGGFGGFGGGSSGGGGASGSW